jgi:branched-chain amino acid transport system ATP-binding protein
LDFSEYLSSNLSFGQQKLLGLARGLITKPKLFLLDEPAAGMSYSEIGALGKILRRIREEQQTALLLVEHHMKLVMEISDRVTVLNFGEKIAGGTPNEIRNDPMVKKAYLGEGA